MKATQLLYNLGQSIWLDHITRDLLDSGGLRRYLDELSVTGLTSNPTIFERAIRINSSYDDSIRAKAETGLSGEALYFELALEDITRAADELLPIYDRTNTVDGWVSLEVSPLLAYDPEATLAAAKSLYARAARPNVFIKIPGTRQGLAAIEEAIFAGIPINVTLLFSRKQYLAASDAFLRGIERRLEAGLNPNVGSIASVVVSRWDVAVANRVSARLRNELGIAVAKQTYRAARALLTSPPWQRIYNAGARPQRLLWASTGDPNVSEIFYAKALAAPFTVNTMTEATLTALKRNHHLNWILPADGGDCELILSEFASHGIYVDEIAPHLQDEGVRTLVKSWNDLITLIELKSTAIKKGSWTYVESGDQPRQEAQK